MFLILWTSTIYDIPLSLRFWLFRNNVSFHVDTTRYRKYYYPEFVAGLACLSIGFVLDFSTVHFFIKSLKKKRNTQKHKIIKDVKRGSTRSFLLFLYLRFFLRRSFVIFILSSLRTFCTYNHYTYLFLKFLDLCFRTITSILERSRLTSRFGMIEVNPFTWNRTIC